MSTLVVLQPGYLPWLGFFDQMMRADYFVYYDDVQFDKHGWRNRNRVKGPNGPVWLTVPVRHKGRTNQLINTVEISGDGRWHTKHIRTIRELYTRASFTSDHIEGLDAVLGKPYERLVDLCYATVEYFRTVLEISTPTFLSSELGIGGDRSERLINLCRHFGADTYLSGDAARSYLQTELFEDSGIKVLWQKYEHPIYLQQHGPFITHLSIVDLVLNMGSESRSILASG